MFKRVGFGESTGSGFPGEVGRCAAAGQARWGGRGKSHVVLRLRPQRDAAAARAGLFGAGQRRPAARADIREGPAQPERAVIDPALAQTIVTMLETVITPRGAMQAAVLSYRVAGKTGTSRQAVAGGYERSRYISPFAGVVPASNPRLVGVVVIHDPQGGEYYRRPGRRHRRSTASWTARCACSTCRPTTSTVLAGCAAVGKASGHSAPRCCRRPPAERGRCRRYAAAEFDAALPSAQSPRAARYAEVRNESLRCCFRSCFRTWPWRAMIPF